MLIHLAIVGCSSAALRLPEEIVLGMTEEQVTAVFGEAANRSSRGNQGAWRYEQIVRVGPCTGKNSGCRYACEHIIVWFDEGLVTAISAAHIFRRMQCGSDPNPVQWDYLPDHAILCQRDRVGILKLTNHCPV